MVDTIRGDKLDWISSCINRVHRCSDAPPLRMSVSEKRVVSNVHPLPFRRSINLILLVEIYCCEGGEQPLQFRSWDSQWASSANTYYDRWESSEAHHNAPGVLCLLRERNCFLRNQMDACLWPMVVLVLTRDLNGPLGNHGGCAMFEIAVGPNELRNVWFEVQV